MHSLKVPDELAGGGIESKQRIGEEIVTCPIPTVEIVYRRTSWDVDDSPFCIDRHTGPVIGSARRLPCVFGPGFVSLLARMRDGVKRPADRSVRTSKARISPGGDA